MQAYSSLSCHRQWWDLRLLSHWPGLASGLYPTICVPVGKSPDISEPTRVTPGLLVPKSSLPTECWHLGGCVGRTTVRLEKGSSYHAWDSRMADTWPQGLGSGPCECLLSLAGDWWPAEDAAAPGPAAKGTGLQLWDVHAQREVAAALVSVPGAASQLAYGCAAPCPAWRSLPGPGASRCGLCRTGTGGVPVPCTDWPRPSRRRSRIARSSGGGAGVEGTGSRPCDFTASLLPWSPVCGMEPPAAELLVRFGGMPQTLPGPSQGWLGASSQLDCQQAWG